LPGVDTELVPEKWFENAFKWIVLKLVWYDRYFIEPTQIFLNPENVMLELKYRYDREIDFAEHPVLRKILEKEDSPSKPICLYVADIYTHLDRSVELELSDGWYGIRTQIDGGLRHFVKSEKIKIGTRLVLQIYELVGISETRCFALNVSWVRLFSKLRT
jgi:breast cancer 2 susceptibility protein